MAYPAPHDRDALMMMEEGRSPRQVSVLMNLGATNWAEMGGDPVSSSDEGAPAPSASVLRRLSSSSLGGGSPLALAAKQPSCPSPPSPSRRSDSSESQRDPLRFAVGDMCVSLKTTLVRTGESFESEVVTAWPAGRQMQVLSVGSGPRICVHDVTSGWEGWISTYNKTGAQLVEASAPASSRLDGILKFARGPP
mmetsp:Transcript_80428/g.232325  ORF Transcript_80428/g.232325 Transcript_80428/m.232325 type:complete len:194 (-) Transcript_80428:186-767(-)|eukprot:CAMPEP_0170241912 /NCGR_PEP_ID=MMETSP0116_2-20130129/20728_1 /TAXON_ID=400756 /ORGANISM="Durinskia baltica, Strain CSIRO CS-38" /LENGTH=193 /DNA_ID=CAMNT_0010492759 /DNA_START=99 /DNA_END=680 /DNA_ORIENTATION=+